MWLYKTGSSRNPIILYDYQKRYEIRLEKLSPILEDFKKCMNIEIKDALLRSPLGKAL